MIAAIEVRIRKLEAEGFPHNMSRQPLYPSQQLLRDAAIEIESLRTKLTDAERELGLLRKVASVCDLCDGRGMNPGREYPCIKCEGRAVVVLKEGES